MSVTYPTRSQIKLLCHFNNDTTDSSIYNRSATEVGTIAYSSSSAYRKWGYSMRMLRSGSDDWGYLSYNISDVDLSGAFCIDYWFRSISASYWGQYVWQLSNEKLQHKCGAVAEAGFYTEEEFYKVTQSRSKLHHVAVSRDGSNVLRWFFNGEKQCEYTTTTDFTSPEIWLSWTYSNGTSALTWMDEVRVVSGSPCYTEDFTLPTEPYDIPDKQKLPFLYATNKVL